MRKIKVKINCWHEHIYSASADIGRRAYIDTTNYKSAKLAKRAFIESMNRLGVPKDAYEFAEGITNC